MIKTEFHYGSSEFGGKNVFFGARICELEVLPNMKVNFWLPEFMDFAKSGMSS